MPVRRIATTLRKARRYSPFLFGILRTQAQRESGAGQLVNLSLWVVFNSALRVRMMLTGLARVRARTRRGITAVLVKLHLRAPADQRPFPAGQTSVDQRPWLKALVSRSTSVLGNRILIIAELSIPQCKRYRVDQKVEMLRHLGHSVKVLSWTDLGACRNALQLHRTLIFYRVPAVPETERLIEEARRLGVNTLYDIDDLVFDLEHYRRNKNVLALGAAERQKLLKGARLYRRMLSLCDHGIASTATIAASMQEVCSGRVFVIENGVDGQLLAIAEEMGRRPLMATAGTLTIGYGSGTTTHDADFLEVAKPLAAILERFPQVRLAVHGYLSLPEAFSRFSSRILQVGFLESQPYDRAISAFDINIAPLEPTVFNDAKSNIKFLEASVFAVPTVASPAAAFTAAVAPGTNGLIARSEDEWEHALALLIANPQVRGRLGAAARQWVLDRYHYAAIAEAQLKPLVDYFSAPPEPSPRLKVLVVNILFEPLSFGGATIVAEQLARELNADDAVSVTVFTGSFDTIPLPDLYDIVRYETSGLPVIAVRVPHALDPLLEYRNPEVAKVFSQVLDTVRPDIVHFHSIQALSASLAHSCKAAGIPYVITLHDAWWLCEKQFMVKDDGRYCFQTEIDLRVCASGCTSAAQFTYQRSLALREVLDDAALLLTPSDFQRNLYLANGTPPGRIRVNRNGVLPPQPRNKTDDTPGKVRFAYLGGRAHHKGYFFLRSVFRGLPHSNYLLKICDIHLRLGVKSIDRREWRVAGQVEIVPPYDQTTIDAFLAEVDVLLFPSQWKESFGLTIREALARDIWVVMTDSGGTTEDASDGVNANIVPIGDLEGFRAALRNILDDPAFLRTYANPHKRRIRTFAEQAAELQEILVDCVERHSRTESGGEH